MVDARGARSAVPEGDERDHVGVTIEADPLGRRRLAAVWRHTTGGARRTEEVKSCRRLPPLREGADRVLRWEIALGRASSRRILYLQQGRYFFRKRPC